MEGQFLSLRRMDKSDRLAAIAAITNSGNEFYELWDDSSFVGFVRSRADGEWIKSQFVKTDEMRSAVLSFLADWSTTDNLAPAAAYLQEVFEISQDEVNELIAERGEDE